ncbi:class I SAM-dependent methyltransferase [Neptunitalea lumnitzerae]|nr:class I SAM-dependent methyltransferase [Neptunitalea sp. Y10]
MSIFKKTSDNNGWYACWFNTPFYHILYKNHDYSEAKGFMDTLTNYLNLPEQAHILDVACGRGRHSIYLNSIGYNVTGIDISEENIAYAKKYENPNLFFEVHDMCNPYSKKFDAVFNLFTSFGYFENEEDNLQALKALKENLNETGFGVIDFMNTRKVIECLTSKEEKTVEGITFNIHKYVEDGYIFKNIKFSKDGEDYDFTERVKALTLQDFENYFEQAGIYLLDVFGDYKLKKFDEKESDRMILIFK